MSAFRVGVVGAGWVACDRHIPSFAALPGVEVVAIVDHDPKRAGAAAERLRIPTVVDSFDRLLDLDLDAVTIATPPWSHAELAITALDRGLHVFCEKPMAMSVDEATGMAMAAERSGRTLTVSHNFSFSRAARSAERFLGREPDLRYASAVQLSSPARRLPTWYRDLPAGLLFDESPHLLYTLARWCGDLEVEAATASWDPAGEPAVVEVLFRGRIPARATMVFGAPLSEWHVTLVGGAGVVDLDLFRDIAVRLRPDGAHGARDILRTSATGMLDHAAGFAASGALLARGRLRWGHDRIIAAFVDAAQGRGPNPVPLRESVGVVRLTADILARIGEPVRA